MHKKTFLKPFHKTAEFCSTCHKVGLPFALNHYKEFLRGQNHYDTFLLSRRLRARGAELLLPAEGEGRTAPTATCRCSRATTSARKDFDGSGGRKIHNHLFPGANTGLFALLKPTRVQDHAAGFQKTIDLHADYLRGTPDARTRRSASTSSASSDGGGIDGRLLGPLRPELPTLKPGESVPGRDRRPHPRPRPPVHARGRSTPTRSGSSFERHGGRPGRSAAAAAIGESGRDGPVDP